MAEEKKPVKIKFYDDTPTPGWNHYIVKYSILVAWLEATQELVIGLQHMNMFFHSQTPVECVNVIFFCERVTMLAKKVESKPEARG